MSERLGHSNPAYTIATYQHALPGMQAEAADTFEQLIKPKNEGHKSAKAQVETVENPVDDR